MAGLQEVLLGHHNAGKKTSASSKGREREALIAKLLSVVFPHQYRFHTGDIIDLHDNQSGQVDIVVEYPLMPSLAVLSSDDTRLYLAESVAAVIEVKSELDQQWSELERTSDKLASIERAFGDTYGAGASKGIPLIAVGYRGWKKVDTLVRRLEPTRIAAALVVERGLWAVNPRHTYPHIISSATGPGSIWAFICFLHRLATSLKWMSTLPDAYALGHLCFLKSVWMRMSHCDIAFNIFDVEGLPVQDKDRVLRMLEQGQLEGFLEHDGSGIIRFVRGRMESMKFWDGIPFY